MRSVRVARERHDVRRRRTIDDLARAVGVDAIDDRRIAGADPEPARRVDGERPDVFLAPDRRTRARGAVAVDDVDLAVGAGRGVDARAGRRRSRRRCSRRRRRPFLRADPAGGGSRGRRRRCRPRACRPAPAARLQICAGVDVSRFVSCGPAVSVPSRLDEDAVRRALQKLGRRRRRSRTSGPDARDDDDAPRRRPAAASSRRARRRRHEHREGRHCVGR